MRKTLIFLTVCGLLLSCNQSNRTKVASDTTIVTQQTDTAASKTERQILIEELKRLQALFATMEKQKIADLFPFPLSNETVGIYIDDSTFNEEYEKNGNKATKTMFIQYYGDISKSLQIDQVNQLFKKLNIDHLLQEDSLEHEAIIKAEPCYHYYRAEIDKDLVTLTVGTNSNKNYKSKSISEDEIPENSSEMCEHMLWWVFRFDGKQLHFKEISGAG